MGLKAFLAGIGLSQYAEIFATHDVDLDTLHLLTDEDLVRLGISLGHRRKLLAALTGPHAALAAALPRRPAAARVPVLGPRRQITVMFCDLVSSTAMGATLDPEETERVLQGYYQACLAELARFDGYVEAFMGDGIAVLFGFPEAREDAAERAIRAGLGVIATVGRLTTPSGVPLAVRIGIASGLVVVAERSDGGPGPSRSFTGDTMNLAARLQGLASPGSIVISPRTRQLVAGLFDLEDLGPTPVKGLPEPVALWRVRAERRTALRFEARHGDDIAPPIGRDDELALLADRWAAARGGHGQVVLLSGEPGIGKSHLAQALRDGIAGTPHAVIRYQGSPFHANSALQPAVAQLEHAAGVSPTDPAEARLNRLATLLATSSDDPTVDLPVLASLLSIPSGAGPALPPGRWKQRVLAALWRQLAGLARRHPVLFLVEDAHWMDPTTQELLTLCIARIASAPVMMLVTFRPEFLPPWRDQPHIRTLRLNRLSRRAALQLLSRVARGKDLPPEVRDQILAKTEGVPLFVEELTRTVLESGLLVEQPDSYVLAGPLRPLAIPSTLADSLLARLDRLEAGKGVAQIGAVIGREFPYRLLAALTDRPPAMLDAALRQLMTADLLSVSGTPPDAAFAFRHALIRDAAYGTLRLSQRQELHARCVQAMGALYPDLAMTAPDVLAHHYTEAGQPVAAVEHWLRAGRRAAERSANLEAIGHLQRGLEVLAAIPAGAERDGLELRLQNALGMPLIAVRGYGAPETGAAWARAGELAEAVGDAAQLVRALYGLWAHRASMGLNHEATAIANRMYRQARRAGDDGALLVADRVRGVSLHVLGHHAESRRAIEAAIARYDPARHRPLAHLFGQDQLVAGLANLSLLQWIEGYPDQAVATAARAVGEATALEHANSVGYALAYGACVVALMRRDGPALDRLSRRLIDYATAHSLDVWGAYGLAFRAAARALGADGSAPAAGEPGATIDALHDMDKQFARPGTGMMVQGHRAWLAGALVGQGCPEEAERLIDDVLAEVRRREEGWCLPELMRLKGELLLTRTGDRAQAAALFRGAVDLASAQGARGWALRAATSLAALWSATHPQAARKLLAPIIGGFTEGRDTVDLRSAQALLDRLAA